MSRGQYEDRVKNWKNKAIVRRQENAYLQKRVRELLKSCDSWKRKFMGSKSSGSLKLSTGKKAKGHHYSLLLVTFMVELYRYGSMSLRSCRHTLSLHFCLGLEQKIPSHNSIRN